MGWNIEIDRAFWDSGIASEVGGAPSAVYLAIRAYQRTKPRDRDERQMTEGGFLFATVSKAKLAKAAGMTRPAVYRALEVLIDKGWIREEGTRKKETIFILGEGGEFFTCVTNRYTSENRETRSSVTNRYTDVSDSGQGCVTDRYAMCNESIHPKDPVRPRIEDPVKNPGSTASRKPIRRVKRDNVIPFPLRSSGSCNNPTPKPPSRDERVLASARAKRSSTRVDEPPLTGEEVVALWLAKFEETFGSKDPDLRTATSRKRAARLVVRRISIWFEGDQARARRYLGETIAWWRRETEAKAKFPSGLPSLAKLLEQKPGGEVSYFYKQWLSRNPLRERADG